LASTFFPLFYKKVFVKYFFTILHLLISINSVEQYIPVTH